MAIIWNGLALLFFVSLFMVSVSVFTPKTAIFFKEKTKIRGAILWMSAALVCAVLVNEFGPGFVPPEKGASEVEENRDKKSTHLPGYTFRIAENRTGELLVIDCTLATPVDEAVLEQLALKVYVANKGGTYNDLRIQWFIEGAQKNTPPWAVTSCIQGNWSIKISAINKKMPGA